jgi:hypothetical protein
VNLVQPCRSLKKRRKKRKIKLKISAMSLLKKILFGLAAFSVLAVLLIFSS